MGVFAAGCNERHPSSARFDSAVVQARVEADWDDIDAAVEVGAGQAECAIARTEVSPDGLERRFKLTHISGRRGELLARIEPGSRLDPRPITLSCSMGALTDPALERLIVRRITLRLADLKGKEFAPIRQ